MPRSATTTEPREGVRERIPEVAAHSTSRLGDDGREPAASLLASLWGRGLYAFVVRKTK